jgi:hypothetical protein
MKDNNVSIQHSKNGLNCPRCGSAAMVIDKAPYHIRDKYIGEFEAIVCKTCNYSLFTPAGYDNAMLEARKHGLVGPVEEIINKPHEIIKETMGSSDQQLIFQEPLKGSIFTLQFAGEAAAHTIKDQNNRYINMKFIKSK